MTNVRFIEEGTNADVTTVDMPEVPRDGDRVMLPVSKRNDELGVWIVTGWPLWWPAHAPDINPITGATVTVQFTGRTLEQTLRGQ